MNTTIVAAVIAAIGAVVVAPVVAFYTSRMETRKQAVQLRHELELQEHRLRAELRTEYMAEAAIHQMLMTADEKRSFVRIRARVGGFTDEELRRLLVRAGALRYFRKEDDEELWGLRDRNEV